ncbi:PDZ domain-containing protein [Nakamurella silvestris]|nr:PDZ domain-containing protein [Nakamurella silvestris]
MSDQDPNFEAAREAAAADSADVQPAADSAPAVDPAVERPAPYPSFHTAAGTEPSAQPSAAGYPVTPAPETPAAEDLSGYARYRTTGEHNPQAYPTSDPAAPGQHVPPASYGQDQAPRPHGYPQPPALYNPQYGAQPQQPNRPQDQQGQNSGYQHTRQFPVYGNPVSGSYGPENQAPAWSRGSQQFPPPSFGPSTIRPSSIPPASGGTTTQERGKGRRSGLLVASVLVLALGAGIGGGVIGSNINSDKVNTASADTSINQGATQQPASVTTTVTTPGSVESVANKVLPSVVSVVASSSSAEGEGSGVILSADGLILTNNHVIDGATNITVRFNDGTTAKAEVVGTDPTDDLAVIKATGTTGLTPAVIGTSADVKVGEQVVAIGSPLGLSATVTTGIVSALNRPVRTESSEQPQQQQQQSPGNLFGQDPTQQDQQQAAASSASSGTVLNAIQTDAAINPGNSGGPLVNMKGEVIGINSAIATLSSDSSSQSGSIGVGFSIPIDQANRIAQEIIKTGKASYAVLGASVGDAVEGDSNIPSGAEIKSVTSGGAAEAAGLKVGDVVTSIDGHSIESSDALVAAIRSSVPGGKVTVILTRNGEHQTVEVTLGSAAA